MIIEANNGEVVTVILGSGARLAGELQHATYPYAEVDGWTIDLEKIQAWKLGVHPYRDTMAKLKRDAKAAEEAQA